MNEQKKIKTLIKKKMFENEISYYKLFKLTKINICKLIYILNFPFCKIRLSQGILICKALNMKLSELF